MAFPYLVSRQALTYVLRAAPPEAVALELPRVLPLLVQALSCDVKEVRGWGVECGRSPGYVVVRAKNKTFAHV